MHTGIGAHPDREAVATRQEDRRDELQSQAEETTRSRLNGIYEGAVQAAAAQVTDPDAPSRAEMIAGAATYFTRLGTQPVERIMEDIAEEAIPPIAGAELEMLEERRAGRDPEILLNTRQEEQWVRFLQLFFEWRRTLFTGPVQQTTRRQVMAVLEEVVDPAGITEGGGIEAIAKEMEDRLQGLARQRARLIARTELVSASNFATLAAGERYADNTGTDMVTEWISILDSRTRDDEFNHREPDGQIVPLHDPFTVSGERLQHPGDVHLGASAGNVIQCRCTMAPLFRDDVNEDQITQP